MVITSKNLQILLPRRISQMLAILMIAFIYEKEKDARSMPLLFFFYFDVQVYNRKSVDVTENFIRAII